MRVKPRMCKCRQCTHYKKYRNWQRHYFAKAFRRKTKQSISSGNFDPINHTKIINYFTD